jgi:hypothetical protein
MRKEATKESEREAITKVVQHYIDGAKSGRGEDMKPAFHEDATIFGYVGAELFAGPIDQLFTWIEENGPATGLQARIADIDLVDTVATLRLELDDWTGHRFTDLFALLKVDGEWKIMNKVFHLHPAAGAPAVPQTTSFFLANDRPIGQ